MFDHIEEIFTDLELMLKKLKKLSYEANMNRFRNEQGRFIDEMIRYVNDADDVDEAVVVPTRHVQLDGLFLFVYGIFAGAEEIKDGGRIVECTLCGADDSHVCLLAHFFFPPFIRL